MDAIRNMYWTEGFSRIYCLRIETDRRACRMAAIWPVALYLGVSLCAFAVLLAGLLALAAYPIPAVLVTIGGMALLLRAAAGLCGTRGVRESISGRTQSEKK